MARVPGEWLMPIPTGMSARDAMAFGTAGLTAMLCVLALEGHGISAEPVVVTGASGGVGSVAIALLRAAGFEPIAVTGRPELEPYLRALGAQEVLSRNNISEITSALGPERWRAAIDTVGGVMLASLLSQISYEGCVAACGLAGGSELNTTVFPFILRGVTLAGIDSVMCLPSLRQIAWERLSQVPQDTITAFSSVRRLDEIPALAHEILAGKVQGRIAVALA
jgi:acrylyl-CoA reductase (NADPH)